MYSVIMSNSEAFLIPLLDIYPIMIASSFFH